MLVSIGPQIPSGLLSSGEKEDVEVKLNKVLALLPLAAITAHVPAYASTHEDGYVGISFGQATVADFCDGGESSCDDSSVSFRLYGGTEINGYTSFEVGYQYMDDVEAEGYVGGTFLTAAVNGHFVDTTLQVGLPEAGPFKIFSKAGLMLWRLNYDASASNSIASVSVSDNDTGIALRTGLGASYELSEQLRLRADWDFLLDVGDEDGSGEADINIFSVGSEFRF